MNFKDFLPPILLKLVVSLNKKNNDYIVEDISILTKEININSNNSALILGNGPSLTKTINQQSSFLKDKVLFCLNTFGASKEFTAYKPNFYVIADPIFWDKNISDSKYQEYAPTINALQKATWKINLLLPHQAKDWNILDLSQNKNISVYFYRNNGCNNITSSTFNSYKKNQSHPHYQNVLIAAIFQALNLGFKTIFLIGADMSLHNHAFVGNDNIVYHNTPHFYSINKVMPSPFIKGSSNITFKMHELLRAFALMFEGFQILEMYSKYLDSKIYNATPNSFIDAFERLELS
ncbi:6-hydroxymethylpterin diphosphokinase MptE-like protein [Labilibacter marinus]|uniref:6-hydroxymethylpterin diphosphokinase MptE-like protein n=1 Tax=Labilibacter marinus TaxID=1477105 RepID=UPI00094F5551|nr:6-hydroxymethylpterin diphosphokinase MptE-like protein [Labilibacter marinus]